MQHTDVYMLPSFFVRYSLTLSDYFSEWFEAGATSSKEARQVVNTLYKVIQSHNA